MPQVRVRTLDANLGLHSYSPLCRKREVKRARGGHYFTGYGKILLRQVVEGHDFSRAAKIPERRGASAPEVSCQRTGLHPPIRLLVAHRSKPVAPYAATSSSFSIPIRLRLMLIALARIHQPHSDQNDQHRENREDSHRLARQKPSEQHRHHRIHIRVRRHPRRRRHHVQPAVRRERDDRSEHRQIRQCQPRPLRHCVK